MILLEAKPSGLTNFFSPGTIPAELFELKELLSLHLSFNQFGGKLASFGRDLDEVKWYVTACTKSYNEK